MFMTLSKPKKQIDTFRINGSSFMIAVWIKIILIYSAQYFGLHILKKKKLLIMLVFHFYYLFCEVNIKHIYTVAELHCIKDVSIPFKK